MRENLPFISEIVNSSDHFKLTGRPVSLSTCTMTFTLMSNTHFIIVPVHKVLHELFSLLLVMTTSVNLVIQILIGNLTNSILLILFGTRRDAEQLNNHVVKLLVSHGSTRPFNLPLLTILS